jgi:DNA-binding cell septation regulator SpoVG
MNTQVTEVRIRPANEELVQAYASICFDEQAVCPHRHSHPLIRGENQGLVALTQLAAKESVPLAPLRVPMRPSP